VATAENDMKRSIKKFLVVTVTLLIVLVTSGYFLLRRLDQGINELNQAKAARRTTATVVRKQHVKFDETNHFYVSDLGDVIEVVPGTEQWRVYYRINNFDQVPEPKRSALSASEQERIAKYGDRFHYWGDEGKDIYESVKEGDTLEVTYRYIGNEKEIINVSKLNR
jgi:hypothetical protein